MVFTKRRLSQAIKRINFVSQTLLANFIFPNKESIETIFTGHYVKSPLYPSLNVCKCICPSKDVPAAQRN